MKIRRYLGSNTQEAILKVKMDLGSEALILNTRKVHKKGILRFFSKPMVEVLAAIDEYATAKEQKKEKPVSIPTVYQNDKISILEDKVDNMEMLLKKTLEKIQIVGRTNVPTEAEIKPVTQSSKQILQLFYNNLIKNEVESDIAGQIINTVQNKVGENASINDCASVLYNIISGMLGKSETIRIKENSKPTVAIFIGPTGVGKTTTLAKIAANYLLTYNKTVGLITADTYRIAAVDQLKTYAEILGLPLSIVYSPNEMRAAIDAYSDKDIILIDTAGRSFNNTHQLEELKTLAQTAGADEIFLVLSSTTGAQNHRRILESYSFLKDYKLIFTKIDESQVMGIILNTRIITGKTLSYLTMGQSVPDDIEVANIENITKNLLGSISK